jgi:hypothetical protein
MKILIVCDAINKFIGDKPEVCERIANFMSDFHEKNPENKAYTLILQRVVDKYTKTNSDLNAAILTTTEAEMPKIVLNKLQSHSNAVIFRKSLNPFENSQPDLNNIVGVINDFVSKTNDKVESITVYFSSKDKIANYAVIKSFKKIEEFKKAEFSYIFLK